MEIKELQNKWSKEKSSYANKEVGSGVQKYVKDVFDTYSKQLLGLLGVRSQGIIN